MSEPSTERHWGWTLLIGVLMLIGGLICARNPFAASLAVEVVAATTFLFAGAAQLLSAFRLGARGAPFWALCGLGVLGIAIGLMLIRNPLAGLVSITFMLATGLIANGLLKIGYGWQLHPAPGWWWLPLSGLLSLSLAGLLLAQLLGASMVTLGLLLAIELISTGLAFVFTAFLQRRLVRG